MESLRRPFPGAAGHLGEESHPNANVLAHEAFECQPYKKGIEEVHINKERAAAFRKTTKKLDSLPPTQDALQLHLQRVNHQVLILKIALQPCSALPNPDGNGGFYNEERVLNPKLMTQEEISASCLELALCDCTREGNCCVNRRCTCVLGPPVLLGMQVWRLLQNTKNTLENED